MIENLNLGLLDRSKLLVNTSVKVVRIRVSRYNLPDFQMWKSELYSNFINDLYKIKQHESPYFLTTHKTGFTFEANIS